MKCTLFLYTESDNTKGRRLMSYFQGRLGRIAEVRGIKNILVRKQDFRYELRSSQCVVLVGTRQASSLIQNKVVSSCTGTQRNETLTNCVTTPCMDVKTIGIPPCTGTPGQPPKQAARKRR